MAKPITVDVSVLVMKEGKILLGQRKKSRENRKGYKIWEFPGGAMKSRESFKRCGLRETKQETGLVVKIIDETPAAVTNDLYKTGAHEVTVYLRATYVNGKPKVKEPKIFKRWEWFPWDEFPENLSTSLKNLLLQGYNPFIEYESR